MNVLFATWELAPFFKKGGLGDIARSLPLVLYSLGVDIRVIVPYYIRIELFGQKNTKIGSFKIDYAGKKEEVNIYQSRFFEADIPIYFLENHTYLNVPSKDTFAFFNLALVCLLEKKLLSWQPDIVHCNDHHTGLVPLLIKHKAVPAKTLLTIHNLYYQGIVPIDVAEKMGINHSKCQVLEWERKSKKINFLLEGIIHADVVNTVSPTYAKEIFTLEYGEGIEEILLAQKQKIYGILNGIDYKIRNPENDKYISYHYSLKNIKEKKNNKTFLQKKLGLDINDQIPLISFIGRLTNDQKGIELMYEMMKQLDLRQYQFVFLGQGNEEWENKFLWLSRFNSKNIYFSYRFDEPLASQIYAGSDFILIPSLFEPCGLVQMTAMCYGTIPIARSTGGLKDSIIDGVDGFLFEDYSVDGLKNAFEKAISIRKENPRKFNTMIEAAMKKDFSWNKSAKKYINLYNKLLSEKSPS
jgi:starch synthase